LPASLLAELCLCLRGRACYAAFLGRGDQNRPLLVVPLAIAGLGNKALQEVVKLLLLALKIHAVQAVVAHAAFGNILICFQFTCLSSDPETKILSV